MAYAELGMRVEAPADDVWRLLAGEDLGQLILSLYAESFEREGQGAGTVTTTTLRDGAGVVRERIDLFDEEERRMRYSLLDSGPLPYANYRGEVRVVPSGAEACTVSFEVRYVPVGMEEQESIRMWRAHNTEVVHKVSELLGVGEAR